jgi:ABC-type cobalamin/Fe3+-siderophores transport system ATPase subunit
MPTLSLESIRLSYYRNGDEVTLLRDATLEVSEGELVVVYGGRGAGKTALLRAIAGASPPNGGVVRLGRRTVTAHEQRIQWVDAVAPPLADLPAAIHVSLPMLPVVGHRGAQRVAMDALATVGAGECADRAWGDLSQRERPLVALAHALVQQPSVLLLDDVTRGLGAVEKGHLMGLLNQIASDLSIVVLVATSDLEILSAAPRVRYLTRGRLLRPDAAARASML